MRGCGWNIDSVDLHLSSAASNGDLALTVGNQVPPFCRYKQAEQACCNLLSRSPGHAKKRLTRGYVPHPHPPPNPSPQGGEGSGSVRFKFCMTSGNGNIFRNLAKRSEPPHCPLPTEN